MRRADREVVDAEAIDAIIRQSPCCRLGLRDGEGVYLVPLCFGFSHSGGVRTFYFHSAPEGRKLELLHRNASAAFELDCRCEITAGETACQHSARYQSVIGTGRVRFLTDAAEKRAALAEIMRQNAGAGDWSFPDAAVSRVTVFALDVETISAKQHL